MREAMAITGYVPDKLAAKMKSLEFVDVMPERDVNDVVMRVATSDIEDARIGSTDKSNLTMVQLILRDNTKVETIFRSNTSPEGMRAFNDPVLNRVRQEATTRVIMI
ncbi:hypothetical protein [uncultured Hoeflea sp.]|uniref:hypothetical protein n=1 Tax=uncultured Hoeflea sp. TaxID=538666 RepID=UPI002616DFE0|nr:hypothetical protein [uncultured Hoeflea sp.]